MTQNRIGTLNAAVKYVDPESPSGFTQTGYQTFAQIVSQQGIFPVAVPQNPAQGTHYFDPVAGTLNIWNGAQWIAK